MDPYRTAWTGAALLWIAATLALAPRGARARIAAIAALTLVAVLAGAKLHAQVLESGLPVSLLWTDPARLFRLPGDRLGGGLLAGSAVAWIGCRLARVPVAAFADAAAPAACAAVAVGRIGCLLAGCCFGVPSHVPWAVAFPAGTPAHVHHVALGLVARDAATSLPVHPLPLYVVLVLGAGFLAVVRRRRRADPGECALLALTVLGLGQAVLEPLRDTAFTPPVPLRQAIPLAMGLVGLAGVWWCQGRCRSSGGGDVRA